MNRDARLSQLADSIVLDGSITVEDVIARFGVSAATVRRDLDELAQQQFIVRTRGGAALSPGSGELPLRYRSSRMGREKAEIAAAAVALIHPGDVIALNGGTTTTEIAQELGRKCAADPAFTRDGVTVVTNAVNIAYELSVREQVRVVVTGGVARSRSYELIGPLTELILPAIDVHTFFLGLDVINVERGILTQNEGEAAVSASLARAAKRVIAVADHTKFSATGFARICAVSDLDLLITDSGAADSDVAAVREAGVEVQIA